MSTKDMSTNLSRRNWLRSSALLATGLVAAPAASPLLAGPTSPAIPFSKYERNLRPPVNPKEIRVRLFANENPFGPSKMTQAGIMDGLEKGNRYGWDEIEELIGMIAANEGVPKTHIMVGPGSSYLLELAAIAHCRKKGNIVASDPTFMSLIRTAMAVGAKWKLIPLAPDLSHDLDAMAKAVSGKTRLVYVCNPNNPTGTLTPNQSLRDFCRTVSAEKPVFVDEAYIHYLDKDYRNKSMVPLINDGHDLIIARTFSKIYGMAGLRVGYVIAQPERIKMMNDISRSAMTLSVTSTLAAMSAMEDTQFIDMTREMAFQARQYTFETLTGMGLKPIRSHTSFMMFPLEAMNPQRFLEQMRSLGVGIRIFDLNETPHCRVSMGTMDEMSLFTDALATTLNLVPRDKG